MAKITDEISARVEALEQQMQLVKQHLSNAGHPLPEAPPVPIPPPETTTDESDQH